MLDPANEIPPPEEKKIGALWNIAFWLFLGLALDLGFLAFRNCPPLADEGVHLRQTINFMNGDWEIYPGLTVIPLYHAVLAVILQLIHAQTLGEARLISFLGSALSLLIFYRLAGKVCPEHRALRTAQFCFFPILFPFFFLLYTDVWALTLVLLAVDRALERRAWQSAIAAGLAIALRQPNLVWAAFVWLLFLEETPTAGPTGLSREKIRKWLVASWPFLVVFAAFAVFVYLNGGVAVGDRDKHQVGLNLANFWFYLLLFPLLFLPSCLAALGRLSGWVKRYPVVSVAALTGFLYLFLITYQVKHLYNGTAYWFFLRNRLLHWTTQGTLAHLLAAVPIVVGAAGFFLTPWSARCARWLPAFTLVSVVILPLIEQRYYLVPMSLFLLWRRSVSERWEMAQLLGYIVLSAIFVWGMASERFFL